jgi:hypothetical protein
MEMVGRTAGADTAGPRTLGTGTHTARHRRST